METGDLRRSGRPSYGAVIAEELNSLMGADRRVVAITAAMKSGTGLDLVEAKHPDRVLDVGITEEHAVTMAAGLAAGGMRPYFAVYASFFQRGWDQVIHDVAMQQLPVVFLLDRSGLVGEDGATHHGVWDLASLQPVPGLKVLAPRDIAELRAMLRWSVTADGPVAIRYGKSSVDLSMEYPCSGFLPGKWTRLEQGNDCALLAVGSMVESALQTHDLLVAQGIRASVISCSTVKPLDEATLRSLAGVPVVTMEEHVLTGGFGSAVCTFAAQEELPQPMLMLGIPDTFVQHGSRAQLLKYLGLTPEQMAGRVAA